MISTKTAFILLVLASAFHWVFARAKLPEASSSLLRMHRMYLEQAPHDTTLYDALKVSPNATEAQITKSYRRLSRKYHPDKQRGGKEDGAAQLRRIQQAYDVLKKDSTRLPYHRYGLFDAADAVRLLTGRFREFSTEEIASMEELLQLMGFSTIDAVSDHNPLHEHEKHYQRVRFVATNVAGIIRPVVEGALPESFLADHIASQCDRLKGLPLGAQIIRCIGRAYRYSGRRLLRRYHAHPKQFLDHNYRFQHAHVHHKVHAISTNALLDLSDSVRGEFRRMKQIANAAVASGKVIFKEKQHFERPTKKSKVNEKQERIEYCPSPDEFDLDFYLSDDDAPTEEEIREQERRKVQSALYESLQVEALWQVSKIELDRVIREACELILGGNGYLFSFAGQSGRYRDGWVGSSGRAIPVNVGRIRAAAALVMLGDIMVQRSKDGTAWME